MWSNSKFSFDPHCTHLPPSRFQTLSLTSCDIVRVLFLFELIYFTSIFETYSPSFRNCSVRLALNCAVSSALNSVGKFVITATKFPSEISSTSAFMLRVGSELFLASLFFLISKTRGLELK